MKALARSFSVIALAFVPLGAGRVASWSAPGDVTGHGVRHAQSARTAVTVNGIAYDSLRDVPLHNAFLSMVGIARSATSDSLGHFQFDSVPSGPYTVVMQHEALDSLGLTGVSIRIRVTDGRDTIRIAAPSFATLWAGACGINAPPPDSGFVYGTIRDARTEAPVADALVEMRWLDLGVANKKEVTHKRWHNEVHTDESGSYVMCGVPIGTGLRIAASKDSLESGGIDLQPRDVRVQRRDLLVGPKVVVDSTLHGTIIGRLRDEGGKPVANAHVSIDDAGDTRSDSTGTFVIRHVLPGTRQLQVVSIGTLPANAIVNVTVHDTARVDMTLPKVTALAAVAVKASAIREGIVRDIEERRRSSAGYFHDSTQIGKLGTPQSMFATFPSAHITTGRGGNFTISFLKGAGPNGPAYCSAILWLDGRLVTFDEIRDLAPADVGAIEMYPHWMDVPAKFVRASEQCGAVVIWTKWKLP